MRFADKHKLKSKPIFQIFMICMAIAFVCFGAYRGEVATVFSKAIRLCLECVGIG